MSNTGKLPNVKGRYHTNIPVAQFNWFRTGGIAKIVFKPADIEDLKYFLRNKSSDIKNIVLGLGSNVIIRDGELSEVLIRLGKNFANISIKDNYLEVGSGVLDSTVAKIAGEYGFDNLAFLCGIPGTIGGALRMNAGCYGSEMQDILDVALAVDETGKLHELTCADMGFSYRKCDIPSNWIFIGARLKLTSIRAALVQVKINKIMQDRKESQPLKTKTGGSTFSNPQGGHAWKLIEQAQCRGMIYGGAKISDKHCNFMINYNNATSFDLEQLGEIVRKKVLETSQVKLKWEIKRLGTPPKDLI